jgi:hypothetical protein
MSEIPMRTMLALIILLLLTLAFFVILTLLGIHPVSVIEIENATETKMQQFEGLIAGLVLGLLIVVLLDFWEDY